MIAKDKPGAPISFSVLLYPLYHPYIPVYLGALIIGSFQWKETGRKLQWYFTFITRIQFYLQVNKQTLFVITINDRQ